MRKNIRKFLSIVVLIFTLASNCSIVYADQLMRPLINSGSLEKSQNQPFLVVSEYKIEYRSFEGKIIPDQNIEVTVWSEEYHCFMEGTLELYSYTYYPYYGIITLANYVGYVFTIM